MTSRIMTIPARGRSLGTRNGLKALQRAVRVSSIAYARLLCLQRYCPARWRDDYYARRIFLALSPLQHPSYCSMALHDPRLLDSWIWMEPHNAVALLTDPRIHGSDWSVVDLEPHNADIG